MEPAEAERRTEQAGASALSVAQWQFCMSIVRVLVKRRDARHFLEPVDVEAWGIPHYPDIIERPMDFSTVERKLTRSDPSKLGTSLYPPNDRYVTTDQFEGDVRLIFSNCITFNGAEHRISRQAKRLEEVFDKELLGMPAPMEVSVWYYVSYCVVNTSGVQVKAAWIPPEGTQWWLEDVSEEATAKKVSAIEAKLKEMDPEWSPAVSNSQEH